MRSLLLLALIVSSVTAWLPLPTLTSIRRFSPPLTSTSSRLAAKNNVDETTKKYGLEAGLLESINKKDNGESAKTLLKKYGIAYLVTSIPLALISMAFFYILVDHGVQVSALLQSIGIHDNSHNEVTEKAGTFAIAYAAHKAASPIRFPPTVLLTPLVAKWIGKEPTDDDDDDETE